MQKKLLFLILFILNSTLLMANAPRKVHEKLPLKVSLPYLKSIQKEAIILGTGPTQAYVFVDPLCPRSQDFIEAISSNKNIQSEYTYLIFLYELKRFHSGSLIRAIYGNKNPLDKMLDVMVHKHMTHKKYNVGFHKIKINDITKVAETINVYKRPYLILVKKRKQ